MKKLTSKLLLLFAALTMGLTSCSYAGNDPEAREHNDKEITDEDIFDEIDLGEGYEIEDKSEYYSNQIYDVDPDFKVEVEMADTPKAMRRMNAVDQMPDNYFSIEDENGNTYDLKTERAEENGKEYFLVSPENGVYEEGAICKIKIDEDKADDIHFKDKDPEIKELYFNVKDKESNYRHIASDVPFFDIRKVTYFPVADEEYQEFDNLESEEAIAFFNNATYHFGYRDDSFVNLAEGRLFGVSLISSTGQPDLSDDNTFYGEFVKVEKENGIYKVTFKNADISEIFQDEAGNVAYDVTQVEEKAEMKNINIESTGEEILEALKQNNNFRRLALAVGEVTGQSKNGIDYILRHFSVAPTFSYKDGVLSIQLKISGTVPFTALGGSTTKMAVRVTLLFQWAISMSTQGGVKIKKFWGVPYKINAYGSVTKTTDFTFSFEIAVIFNMDKEEDSEKSVADRIKEAYTKLENDPAYFMPRTGDKATLTANHLSQPLLSLEVPFGYVFTFRIALSFELTLDLNVFFKYTYKSHEVERMLVFSTSDGVEDTSNNISNTASVHTLELGGQLYVEAGLRFTVSIGVVGLPSIFTLGAYIEGGLYVKLGAMGGLSFGSNQSVTGYGAFDADIGGYCSLTAFLDFLFVFHFKYEFMKKKKSFFGYDAPITIMDTYAKDIETSNPVTDIMQTKLLTVKQFDIPTFTVNIKTYKTSDSLKQRGDTFHPLTITPQGEFAKYVEIDEENNFIVVDPKAPSYFSCKLNIHIDWHVDYFFNGDGSDEKVDFTFKRAGARRVKFGENDTSNLYMQPNQAFKLVEPTPVKGLGATTRFSGQKYIDGKDYCQVTYKFEYDPEYYDFLGYTDGATDYEAGSSYVMPDRDVTITAKLKEITYYKVKFFDCNNNLIKEYKVREFEGSLEPTSEERNVQGYTFLGWDTYFDYVDHDIEVYGIYATGEGGNS